jgi:hypothetical protein
LEDLGVDGIIICNLILKKQQEDGGWIHLFKNMVNQRAPFNTVMNFRVQEMGRREFIEQSDCRQLVTNVSAHVVFLVCYFTILYQELT